MMFATNQLAARQTNGANFRRSEVFLKLSPTRKISNLYQRTDKFYPLSHQALLNFFFKSSFRDHIGFVKFFLRSIETDKTLYAKKKPDRSNLYETSFIFSPKITSLHCQYAANIILQRFSLSGTTKDWHARFDQNLPEQKDPYLVFLYSASFPQGLFLQRTFEH